ncbi:MAG TPA: efflux RND transporter permease subunit, partial [Bacteroidales bacterium]|nr:efflux RND transporter permease subunit [Bacteroidales bacterium]
MSPYFKTYKSPISIILALIIAAGIFAYSRIQTSLFPEITFPKIKIIADNGEQPVDKMMITVTRPLEEAIKQVPDLQIIRSSTSRGSCEISAFFKWKSDIDLDQQMLESRINEIRNELPPSTQINVEKMNPSILQVMGYTLESHTKNPTELRMIADYTVKPFLSQIDGLASVQIMGGKVKEYWVELNQAKMSSIGITPAAIATALNQTNFINSNGYLSDYRRMYLTLTDEGLYHKEDIENVVIKNSGKRVVLLKDLAKIEIREKIEYTKINANGKDAILIGILKQPNANLVSLTDKVKEKITELNNLLPKGVTIEPYYVQADFVNDSLRSVSDSLWIGLLLAIVVAMLFLHSFRASSTILITIPVTIGLTIVV